MQIANGIGIINVERLRKKGIDSIEKLASATVEDLIKIDGIQVNNAKMFIEIAKKHLKSMMFRLSHYAINLFNKLKWYILVEQVSHKLNTDHGRLLTS